ncbi:MAG: hypothetical protein LBK40_00455 [Spirochaetaceae bacterium]|nr:hypothetical protein [Spirochaetaceae bacterium]
MKKVILGLMVLLVFGLLFGCATTGNADKGKSGGVVVWLIKDSDYSAFRTATNDFQNRNDRQPVPTGMAIIENMNNNFNANFKQPKPNSTTDYDADSFNGMWGFTSSEPNITIPAGNYYIILVPLWMTTGSWEGRVIRQFDLAKIYVGSGSTPATISNPTNPQSFSIADFKDANFSN